MTMRTAVAISGRGSNLEALLRALPVAGLDRVPRPVKDRVVEFVVLDDVAVGRVLEADAQVVDGEGAPLHQIIAGAVEVDRLGVVLHGLAATELFVDRGHARARAL